MFPIELMAQSPSVTNWLTPVWLLSVGISIGFLLVLISLAKIWISSKIPFLNSIADGPSKYIFGALLSIAYIGIGFAAYAWSFYDFNFEILTDIETGNRQSSLLFLGFLIPLSLLLGFGAWRLVTPSGAREVLNLQFEGFLFWTNSICLAVLLFAVVGYVLAAFNGFGIIKFVDEPYALLNAATRIPVTGVTEFEVEIPPSEEKLGGTEVDVSFYGEEVFAVFFQTDQPLEIACEPVTNVVAPSQIYSVPASADPTSFIRRPDGSGRIPNGFIEKLFIVNAGNGPATLLLGYVTRPIDPQVWIIPWSAMFVLLLALGYWVCAVVYPKTFAVAFSTFKTEVNQPLFLVVLMVGVLFIMFSIWIPYNTFGEDIKMYKDSGLTLIRVLAIFLAVWAASKSVAEEIEGRTALTVLSKPVSRRQFILGKFAGIGLTVALLFILLGIWFVIWTAYKPIYDGKESASGLVDWQVAFQHGIGIIPALFLVFLEVLIFVAISVAISTRLGILANFLICFAIYVLGHLTPLIVQSSASQFEVVVAFGNLIAIIFPVLNHFDVQAAINTNANVPMVYLGWSVIYCTLYSSIAMLLALALFEDRDLA